MTRETLLSQSAEILEAHGFHTLAEGLEVLATQTEESGPVAWRYEQEGHETITSGWRIAYMVDMGWREIPLYTTPPSSPSLARDNGNWRNTYEGAREDLLNWKRRAEEAEKKVREYDQRIVDIGGVAMNSVSRERHARAVELLREAAGRLACLSALARTNTDMACWADIQSFLTEQEQGGKT